MTCDDLPDSRPVKCTTCSGRGEVERPVPPRERWLNAATVDCPVWETAYGACPRCGGSGKGLTWSVDGDTITNTEARMMLGLREGDLVSMTMLGRKVRMKRIPQNSEEEK